MLQFGKRIICIILGNVRKIEKDVLEINSIGQKKIEINK